MRLDLAANSGARIGMAQDLKSKYQVCWQDPEDASKGFKYIFLTPADYEDLLRQKDGDVSRLPVICQPLELPGGEVRHVISDIIGDEVSAIKNKYANNYKLLPS